MAKELDSLIAAVERNDQLADSTVSLLNGLAASIRSAAGDEARINAIADQINAEADRMAAAVSMNTPQAQRPRMVEIEEPEAPVDLSPGGGATVEPETGIEVADRAADRAPVAAPPPPRRGRRS